MCSAAHAWVGLGPVVYAASTAQLDAWLAENEGPAERTLGVLDEIRTSGSYDLTTLPVALREVRDLIRAGEAEPSRAPLPAPAGG